MSIFGPSALSDSECPKLLEGIIGSGQKMKPVNMIYKSLMNLNKIDLQEVKEIWNGELKDKI